ncbi:MAG: RIP metalloprotease RseP [Sphingomonadales bacterium]|nr:RIP metalloprotease RseP [Sphingomonadales bacterium]PIX65960.1 MAG: RIP metalloprotease RseP [Sphingomonadales bacterium CG_4_10_14_3_um_filter_58_15]NCO48792.1 RIP metalloprotease RseP [Sphingomonadales bacterium]NCO99873.1 RIP metalloprotease RseP [Sphingomonadales bacterium]NCP27361.1 RIP metalloprotease RseP [Sphingomonadales bacterium]
MTDNPGILLTLLAFLIVIGVLVFVHEMGHYLVGRWCGVKADTFAIGFGKEIVGWTDKRGTRWKICMLPLGGYVQFAGDMDPSGMKSKEWLSLPAAERNQTFQSKSLWQRAAIVFAGPAINFLFAILIIIGFVIAYGTSATLPVASQISPNSTAAAIGMKPGDRVISVDGQKIELFEDLRQKIMLLPEKNVEIVYERDGQRIVREGKTGVQILKDRFGNEYRLGLLGMSSSEVQWREVSPLEAPVVAVQKTIGIVDQITTTLGQVITGKRSIKELGGPLKIAQVSGEQFKLGLESFILFVALISINLGFINLLPIPMLDGGHLMFYAIEAVRRKPANAKVQEWAFRSGLALVMVFMLVVTFNDLSSFGLFRSISG